MKKLLAVFAASSVFGVTPIANAAVYEATCQFNNEKPMSCTVNAKPVPFGYSIDWADGISEGYTHIGDGSVLQDSRGGTWRRISNNDGSAEVLKHQNGNVIKITYIK